MYTPHISIDLGTDEDALVAIAEMARTIGQVRSRPFWPTETTEYHDVPSEPRPSTSAESESELNVNEQSTNEQTAHTNAQSATNSP